MSKYVQHPIEGKLEEYLSVKSGSLGFNKLNEIVLKVKMISDIHAKFTKLKIHVKMTDNTRQDRTLIHEETDFQVLEGILNWEFKLKCVRTKKI